MGGWNDASELVVASSGQIYVAPVGTALPAGPETALNSAFVGLGYATEDGVTFNVTPEIREFRSWQSRQPTRRDLVGQDMQVSFALQQWNEETIPFAFGGGTVSSVSGGYKYTPPAATDALNERAMIVDGDDGTRRVRIIIPRGNVIESVSTQFARGALAVLPITFKALEPADGTPAWYPLFDDTAAFAAGS